MTSTMKATKVYAWTLFLALWGVLSLLIGNDLYLPGPITTLAALLRILSQKESYVFLAMSTLRVLLGLGIALVTGILLGFITGLSERLRVLLMPFSSLLKSVPIVSFIMLALLWLGSGIVPVFISFLMSMPLFWTATQESVLRADAKLLEMMQVFQLSFMKKLKVFYFPWSKGYISMALQQAIGLAWKAGVAAEVLSFSPLSIGRKIYESKSFLDTSDLFAWTFLLLVLSFLMERMVAHETARD